MSYVLVLDISYSRTAILSLNTHGFPFIGLDNMSLVHMHASIACTSNMYTLVSVHSATC